MHKADQTYDEIKTVYNNNDMIGFTQIDGTPSVPMYGYEPQFIIIIIIGAILALLL